MKAQTQMMHVDTVPGRVLIGPKRLGSSFARIVSQKDGSGRIEVFDTVSARWLPAPESVTFGEIWSAPAAGMFPPV